MRKDEAIKYLENMKWLKGYDNTMIGDKPIPDIIDEIIALLEEQDDALEQMRLDNKDLRKCYTELLKEHCD